MKKKNAVFVAYVTCIWLSAFAVVGSALLVYNAKISGQGTIKAVGIHVYKDPAATEPLTSADWGVFEPGESKTGPCYVKNDGNVPVALSFYVESWQPANASNFITLTWDYDGSGLAKGSIRQVTFTLTVSANITGIDNFSFEVWVIGTG